ncbi:MAG: type II toxin-antitoxin system RelE/ParE family toxin [Candidatus Nanohaloarchaea archaeon]|nr:type II toxin-antitoxin system RelE/ParE family toxin [Candidatus Nanohaloarchaea archaeon]
MAYTVLIPEPVEREIAGWDDERRDTFFTKVEKLERYPKKFGKPLRGPLSGLWELYFENSFRILYSVDDENRNVYVKEIRHKDDF